MSKIREAKVILKALGLPTAQQNVMSALTLLALCDIKPADNWKNAKRLSKTVTKDIMLFVKKIYKRHYAPNTRETFRRQVLHQFVQAGIADYNPDNPELPVNSPKAHYSISNAALRVIILYGDRSFTKKADEFLTKYNILITEITKARVKKLIPVEFENKAFKLSPGRHNKVEAAIIKDFAPRFAKPGSIVYLGDTENKKFYVNEELLKELNIPFDEHSKLPDVIIYVKEEDWLYLIEAVTSHGPVIPKRILELESLLKNCKSGKIYISAFPDFKEFRRHLSNIAWETEVWLADKPDHLIHYNGDKFIGPRK